MLNTDSLISVIIPVHRFHDHLYSSIRSILNQSYSNIEILIIDDSLDSKFTDFISEFLDNRLKIVLGNQMGLSAALNLGISNSAGKYIARMDSDDIASPDRLSKQLSYLILNDLDICGTNIELFGAYKQKVIFPESDQSIKFQMLFSCPIAHPSILGKIELFKKYNYDITITAAEDYNLWARMSNDGVKFGNCQETLLKYRIHINQSTKVNETHMHNTIQIAESYAKKYLTDSEHVDYVRLNCGFDKNYTIEQVVSLLSILNNVVKRNNQSPLVLNKYAISLFSRINKVSFNVFKSYFELLHKIGIKTNIKFTLFLLFRSLIPFSKDERWITSLKRFT